jgi:NAD(P)-dependent dehydrogenase (short-subunit alcohol dehydrogenase family)
MATLEGKKVLVTGGARGLGRSIVEALVGAGASVTAVGRTQADLDRLVEGTGGKVRGVAGDVRDGALAERLLRESPDVVVLNAGARPELLPIHEHTWESFSAPWDVDVRGTFVWGQLALRLPLPKGSMVLSSSSGAAIGGSPLSGGYAGAKRTQWMMAEYLQRESKALGRGIRFHAIVPRSIVAGSETGEGAIAAYVAGAGLTREKFLERFGVPVTPVGLARGVAEIARGELPDAVGYVVLEHRIEPIGGNLSPAEFGAMR